MKAAFAGVDVVGKGEDGFLVGVVVLQGHVNVDPVPLRLEMNRLGVQGDPGMVEPLHERGDAALVVERLFLLLPFVPEGNGHPGVEEGQLPHSGGQGLVGEYGHREYFRVGQKADQSSSALGRADDLELGRFGAPLVFLLIDLAVAVNLHLGPLRQGVDHRDADAVQTAGNLVGLVVELAAGVELGHDHFHGRDLFRGVHIHRDAPAVVQNTDRVVGVNGHLDPVAITGQGFVDAVVHHLVNQVMKAFGVGVADIHGRPFADGGKAFQDFDFVSAVSRRLGGSGSVNHG